MEENKEFNENNEQQIENNEKKIEENIQKAESNNSQELIPTKKNSGLVIGLVVLVLLLVGALVYVLLFTSDEEKGNNNPVVTATPLVTSEPVESTNTPIPTKDDETKKGDKYLYVYLSKYGQFSDTSTTESEKIAVKVQSSDAKFLCDDNRDTGNFFLYDDNGLKIYDVKNKKSTNIDLSNNYKRYLIHVSIDESKVLGISLVDKNSMASYYNIATKKEMYKNKYKVSEHGHFYNVGDDYLEIISGGKSYLLSAKNESVLKSEKNEDDDDDWGYSYGSYDSNGRLIYSLELCYDDCVFKKLYNDKMEEFYSGDFGDEDFDLYNGAVYISEKNYVKKYDMNGKLLSTSKSYGEIYHIIRNYVVYYKDKSLFLENIDNASESKKIIDDKTGIIYDSYTSGYYSRKALDQRDEKNKKEGIYLVIYYGNDNGNSVKDSNGYYGIEYCYTADKQLIEYPIKTEMGGRAKPVLYLYPEKETNVTVKFAHPEYLTTTYPKYINSWNVTVKPNGDMKDADGKYYYALYWDETRYNEVDFKEGFYVEGKDAIKFLEEKLTIIGLSDKERNEFIMYWLPIMENNGKNLVYFELTKEREASNKLIIEPKPDSLLRVSIHIKKVNSKVNIKEQKLETFNRVGFTAVEWGGMTY